MPALPEIPNVLRTDLLWNVDSDVGVSSRQFFRYSGGPPNSANCVDLAADIWEHASALAGLYSTAVELTGVKVTDLSDNSGGEGVHEQVEAGSRSGSRLPGNAAVLINYVIGRRYRGGRPRTYFPFFTVADINSSSTWVGTSLDDVTTAMSSYFGAVIGLNVGSTTITQHVNVSYYSGFTVVTNPVTGRARNVSKVRTTPLVDDILSWSVASRIASQRRRG